MVHIAAETFLLDGEVKAGGWQSAAGGGIYISVDTLDGAGNIAADGGNGGYAGAGGGRVAVYASDFASFDLDKVTAWGGLRTGGSTAVPERSTSKTTTSRMER